MKKGMVILALIAGMCGALYAEDEKVKGLDIVPDTAVTMIKKLNAYFTGNLEWTMPTGKDIYKNDYTTDPQGRRIPRATLGKYDSGVR